MKRLELEKVYLLSQKEKRARKIEFHPKTNLIVGVNHTGKSSLIKSIFKTLGAKPQGKLKKWDEATISIVQFKVQGKSFKVAQHMGYRGLFDESDQLLTVTGDHVEWSKAFAEVTGFNLLVTNKGDLETVVADPACFFLPFYIDQDGSWQAGWDTFPSSKRFKTPMGAILEYFTGIKPFEWYKHDAKKKQAQLALSDLRSEKKFLDRAKVRLENSLPMSGPKVDAENFSLEIDQLTEEVSFLNAEQEKLRKMLVKERELISSVRAQIVLSQDALKVYEGDTNYLEHEREKLVCPICDAEHTENFLDLFTYAEDARILRTMVLELNHDLVGLTKTHHASQDEMNKLEARYKKISEILEAKKGEMNFKDVVNSMSAEHAFNAFSTELADLESQIGVKLGEIEVLDEKLNGLKDNKRSKRILEDYRKAYSTALISLNLPSIEMKRQKLTSRPALSGSGGPRQILAYYAAIWQTAVNNGDFLIPIVIDSPNQQGQDHINLPKVLEYVSKKLPTTTQLIIGSEIDTEYEFDKKIELSQPYQLLSEDEYDDVEKMISTYTESMVGYLEDS
ncbi:hypothetical protein [Aurantivibrio plasticivorans]